MKLDEHIKFMKGVIKDINRRKRKEHERQKGNTMAKKKKKVMRKKKATKKKVVRRKAKKAKKKIRVRKTAKKTTRRVRPAIPVKPRPKVVRKKKAMKKKTAKKGPHTVLKRGAHTALRKGPHTMLKRGKRSALKTQMPGAKMTKPEGQKKSVSRVDVGKSARHVGTSPKVKLGSKMTGKELIKYPGGNVPHKKGGALVPAGKVKTHPTKYDKPRQVAKAMSGSTVDKAFAKAKNAGLKPKKGEGKKSFLKRVMKTRKGQMALGALTLGGATVGGLYALLKGKKEKPMAGKKPYKDYGKQFVPEAPAKKKAPVAKVEEAPAAKAPAKTAATPKAAAPARTVRPQVVRQKPISEGVGKRVMALRQRHNIPRGGSITGQEAFIAAAATAIAGQVPGIYNTAHSISGFLGKNLRPLGLAGLAGGATWLIAKYLSSHRKGTKMFGADKVVSRSKNPPPRKPSGPSRRPTVGMYKKGMSKRRSRALRG